MNYKDMILFRLQLILILFLSTITGKEYFVYVTSESQDEVHLIMFDGQKGKIIKDISVGVWPLEIEGPHGITISPDGKYWYLSLAHGFPYGHVYKYETGTDKLIDRVELGLFPATMQIEVNRIETGVMPHGSRITNDGLKQYSVAMMSGMLYELDVLKFKISRTLFTGTKKHKHMNHSMGSMKHKEMKSHNMPSEKPTWVYPHPNDKYIYVVNNGTDDVVEIDINKWAISRKFKTDKGPYNCEVSPNGKFLVITYKSAAKTGIWDLKLGSELARIKNTRRITHGVVISPDSKYAFVSVEGVRGEPGSVDIFDLENLRLVEYVEGGKQAGGIAFWKMTD